MKKIIILILLVFVSIYFYRNIGIVSVVTEFGMDYGFFFKKSEVNRIFFLEPVGERDLNQVPNEQFNELVILCNAIREDDDLYRRSCGDLFIKEVKRREKTTTYHINKKDYDNQNININKKFRLKIKDKENNPIINRKCWIIYLSGKKEETTTDENGYIYIENNNNNHINMIEVMMNSPKGELDVKEVIKFGN